MGRSIRKSFGRGDTKSFAGIPRAVMDNPDYQHLSASAVRLLVELAYQYRGGNNGDLTCAWEVLSKRGWRSRTTITKARDELLAANLITCTRHSVFDRSGGQCALYAVVWAAIDDLPKKRLEVPPTVRPIRIFSTAENNKSSCTESGHECDQNLVRAPLAATA